MLAQSARQRLPVRASLIFPVTHAPSAMTPVNDFIQAVRADRSGALSSSGQRLYLLVDHAGAPGLVAELRRSAAIPWSSLFDDSKEQGALAVAPILIHFPDACASQSELDLLAWLRRACEFSTSLTVLNSTLAHDNLAHALKRRLNAQLPDHMPVMLRYFDTRILESLVPVLSPAQRNEFLGIASRWQWLDRAGDLRRLDSDQLQSDSWPHQFEFDVVQQNALIEASTADALVEQMQAHAADLCRPKTRAELHALAERCVPKFDRFAIEDVRTQTLYCLTELQLGPAFDMQSEWAQALERVAKKQIGFEVLLKEMGV